MKKNIIIIGGGIAGLTAGIYAQINGFQATIVEMHEKPGGQLTAWERNGFKFDYCLHWLVGTDHGTFNKIWHETNVLNQDVKIVNHHTYLKIIDQKYGDFLVYNDLKDWEKYLNGIAKEDERGIKKMCRMMRKSEALDPFERPPGMRSIFDYIKAVWRMRSFLPVFVKYGKQDCKKLFEDLGFENERLLYFLYKMINGGDFPAIGLIAMFGWFNARNAGYLMGGSDKMTDRMKKRFLILGGEFKFKNRVKEILVEQDSVKGAKLENGEQLDGDYVISACDGRTVLYDMLKGKYVDEPFDRAYKEWSLFEPLVMVSFGINDTIRSDNHLTMYIQSDLSIGNTKVENFSIMNRSLYDPGFAPEGKSVLLMMFESPWEIWENLKDKEYLKEKANIQKDAKALLIKQYPGIEEKIEVIDIATPKTTEHYTGVWKGAYEGFLPRKDIMDGLPLKLKGLKNFTMIGQWLFPGGGLPPSAQSGKWAIQMLCKENNQQFLVNG